MAPLTFSENASRDKPASHVPVSLRHTNAKPDPIKICDQCGIRYYRRRINGRLEDLTQFSKRQFCSIACKDDSVRAVFLDLDEQLKRHIKTGGADDCWEWQSAIDKKGYGYLNHKGKVVRAHRASFEVSYGDKFNPSLMVCHKCDNRKCCNPSHLFQGTAADNSADMVSKGRQAKGTVLSLPGESNPAHKLNEHDVLEIRKLFDEGCARKELGKRFGISRHHVLAIGKRRLWKHLHD